MIHKYFTVVICEKIFLVIHFTKILTEILMETIVKLFTNQSEGSALTVRYIR